MPNTRGNPEWDVILEVTGPAHWFDIPHHNPFREGHLTRNKRREHREGTQEEELIKLSLKFSTPPRNGTPWFWVGRDEGADVRIESTAAVSGCHLCVGFDEWGQVLLRDTSKFGSKVIYTQLPDADSTGIFSPQGHKSSGNKTDPPQWVVPVGWTVGVILGQLETRIIFQVPDHSYHIDEYQQMVREFQADQNNLMPFLGGLAFNSRPITTGEVLPTAMRSAATENQGRYGWILGRRIGSGGFAEVFEVFNSSNWARGAGKRLQTYQTFQHEYSLMRTLNHSHIARYIDVQNMQGFGPIIIMEYCDLGSLGRQQEAFRFNEDEIMVIMTQALSAIEYLHNHHITHRDLKPDNILIRSREPIEIAVSDFGLSMKGAAAMETVAGTNYYMAPEVLAISEAENHDGFRIRYTNKSDIWSLGVIAVELVHGELPKFPGHRGFDLDYCDNMSKQGLKFLNSLGNQDFAYLVWDMISWDPGDRPTAADCLLRIDELRSDSESDSSESSYESSSVDHGVRPGEEGLAEPVDNFGEGDSDRWTPSSSFRRDFEIDWSNSPY